MKSASQKSRDKGRFFFSAVQVTINDFFFFVQSLCVRNSVLYFSWIAKMEDEDDK